MTQQVFLGIFGIYFAAFQCQVVALLEKRTNSLWLWTRTTKSTLHKVLVTAFQLIQINALYETYA